MSNNVYADLGFPNADEMLAKAGLVHEMNSIIKRRGLTQMKTAEMTGIPQPRLSNILRARFDDISIERLVEGLRALGCDIDVIVRPQEQDGVGKLTVLSGDAAA